MYKFNKVTNAVREWFIVTIMRVTISDRLHLRKRLLHKGYELYTTEIRLDTFDYDMNGNIDVVKMHFKYFNSRRLLNMYLKKHYSKSIENFINKD